MLLARVQELKALLELQLALVEAWNGKFYSSAPGGVAARRLLALKQEGSR